MDNHVTRFAPLVGGILIVCTIFLPWARVPRMTIRQTPLFVTLIASVKKSSGFPSGLVEWLNFFGLGLFEWLAFLGSIILGGAATTLGIGRVLTKGLSCAVLPISIFIIGILTFLFYSLWWFIIAGPLRLYSYLPIEIGAVHIGVYIGLAGSLITLSSLISHKLWK